MAFAFFIISAKQLVAQNVVFYWGLNGHPLTQQDFNRSTWDDQIKYLKDLNVNIYRIDVLVDDDGKARKEIDFIDILNKLKDNKIKSMPTVIPLGINGSKIQQYDQSFSQGQSFCQKYGSYFDVIEVGNEEDNASIINGSVDGSKLAHYNNNKLNNIIVKLKGFIDGAKSVKPSLKVSLSLSWVHFGYLDVLDQNKINYDIIGYHWYSNMGDPINTRTQYGNVLRMVSEKYKRPIWITEFNYFQGTTKADFQKENQYFVKTISNIISQHVVQGLFVYELFDQPALRQQRPSESNYGLIYKNDTGSYSKKDIYDSYKEIIAANSGK